MIKQVSSFLMLCAIAQISFAQTSEKQNLKLDLRKPTVVVVKNIPKDTSIVVNGQTPLYIVDGKELKNINTMIAGDLKESTTIKTLEQLQDLMDRINKEINTQKYLIKLNQMHY